MCTDLANYIYTTVSLRISILLLHTIPCTTQLLDYIYCTLIPPPSG